jgi:hypothetical protein
MPGEYAGHLPAVDPVHGHLWRHVLPDMGAIAQHVGLYASVAAQRGGWSKQVAVKLDGRQR